eukprot:GFUD01045197.1.p1 GENE.GFUD01045197.1~~GFUD01045197.1.p1  ORF type:complete len:1194 (+),score=262.01 GFUD01045197.1:849-4430(+)
MKKVTNLKAVFGSKSKDKSPVSDFSSSYGTSILGNIKSGEFQLPRGISSIFQKTGSSANNLRNTLQRKKDKQEEDELEKAHRAYLAPPMPPVLTSSRLRRVNSSTLSLNRTKKKLLTVEELYVEVLYTVLHMIGCDIDQVNETELINYVRDAFHMEEEKHQQLLEIATMKEEPYLKTNLEVHSARNLIGKDISGQSDPFCTFYLTTNPHARYNTSYKPRTLNPSWNEDFVLDVNSVEQDCLRVDVWDFNPDESVNEKLNKINQVRDGRGLRKFIKETLHATTGKNSHELLGSVEIPLKNIPASGVSGWWNLEKPETKKQKDRGEIHLSLTLSTEKDQHLTSQEHRHLLKILFAHELQRSNAAPFTWNGEFSRESVLILAQHAVQGKLTGADTALARWLVFCHTHCDLPLDYRLFHPILEKLSYALDNSLLHAEEEGKFAEVALVFVNHCVEFIRKHRHFVASDPEYLVQLEYILKCLNLLRGTLAKCNNEVDCNIKEQVEEAVVNSVEDWYNFILDKMPIESNRAMRIKNLTNLANILGQDLREGCESSHNQFKESLNVNYRQLCFRTYEKQLIELCRDFVEETCDKLRPVIFSEIDNDKEYINNSMTIGTGLFELYLALQSLAKLGDELFTGNEASRETFEVQESHVWFNKAVARWLDIALYKAMQRIIKAVELDDLSPVDDLVKHSSSAVDIRTVLMQIKTFWAQLCWPDVESSYAYISKILDDVCKTTIFYADKMVERVSREQNNNVGKFKVSESLCLAINNIDYVLQYIQPFVNELGYEPTLSGLSSLNGDMVANSCRRTLTTLIQNAMENVENKILQVLEDVGEKMAPVIKDFLLKSTNLVTYASRDKTAILNYLDENLVLLKQNLTEDNFERILAVIWESSAQTLEETIYMCIENKKPPSYFKTLLDVLKILCDFFYGPVVPRDETLTRMKLLLQLYASDSADLIGRYYWNRIKEQRALQAGEYKLGSITVRAQLLKDHLRVEVLNARHLKPPEIHRGSIADKYTRAGKLRAKSNINMTRSQKNLDWVKSKFASLKANINEAQVSIHTANTQGQSDPYVSIRLVPTSKFTDTPKHRTRTQRRTLFPLFDETFDFFVSGAHRRLDSAYLQICVKDRGIMGQGIFLGEAYLPLQEVEEENMDKPLRDLPQIQLPLTRPQDQESDLVFALDSRIYDRQAKEFLKKERRKL